MHNSWVKEGSLVSKSKAILLYGIVSFFLFFEMAIQVSPSVMSSELMRDLHIGTFGLGLMSSVYFYSYTAMQLPSGLLFDRYNPRLIISLSILVCALGTLLFAVAPNIYLGSLARLLMGLGSAFAFVAVLVVTADLFKSKYFATLTGITQMLAAIGAMTGQMPISFLLSFMGWRHTLLLLFFIGLALALVTFKLLKYEKSILSTPFHQPTYIKINLKKILIDSQTWYIALYACLLWVPMSTFASLWGVPFLTKVHHLNPYLAALLCSLMWLGLAVGSPLLGLLATTLEKYRFSLSLSAFLGLFSFGLLLLIEPSPLLLGFLLFLTGAACAGQALSFAVVNENNTSEVRGTAIAFNNMAVVVSGALFQPFIGKLIELNNSPLGFKKALLVVWLSYVIAFFIALIAIKESKKN